MAEGILIKLCSRYLWVPGEIIFFFFFYHEVGGGGGGGGRKKGLNEEGKR